MVLQQVVMIELERMGAVLSGSLLTYKGAVDAMQAGHRQLLEIISADTALFDERLLAPLAISLRETLLAFGHLVGCLFELIFYSAIMILKLLVLVFPHILRLGQMVVDFHRTQLTVWDMLTEFADFISVSSSHC